MEVEVEVSRARNGHNSGPQFRGAPPPHHPDRNIFNFQPFPRVFNPWHNFYNFAKRPFQDATERNFLEEGRRWQSFRKELSLIK